MIYESAKSFLAARAESLRHRPTALVFAEDSVELGSTLHHLSALGFGTLAVFAGDEVAWPDDAPHQAARIRADLFAPNATVSIINQVITAAPGAWLHPCYNAEYLFYPFCETRSIRDVTLFQTEERRNAVFTPLVDLYAADLDLTPNGVSLSDAQLDQIGYHARPRGDGSRNWAPKDREINLFGGLRWRFEEHVPWSRRQIDRVSLFRAQPGLVLNADHTFSLSEYNTVSCEWHHSLTGAVCSFRAAKALRANPGSRAAIARFTWAHSAPFTWQSRQLMDLGLMEPGQWF